MNFLLNAKVVSDIPNSAINFKSHMICTIIGNILDFSGLTIFTRSVVNVDLNWQNIRIIYLFKYSPVGLCRSLWLFVWLCYRWRVYHRRCLDLCLFRHHLDGHRHHDLHDRRHSHVEAGKESRSTSHQGVGPWKMLHAFVWLECSAKIELEK